MNPDITLAICTWNRSRVLDGTLRRVAELAVPPGVRWEVIVVDNNSPDDTAAVVRSYEGALPVKSVHEPRQGVAFARNAAVAAAAGDLFVFLDDDCRPAADLLTEYWSAARANPQAAIFGGTIEPEFETPPPAWIANNLDLLACAYGRIHRPGPNRPLGPTESVLSGNMAVRTAVLRRYPFDTSLGRVGTGRVGGEEIDFYMRAVADGTTAYWVGTAAVRHYIRTEAISRDFVRSTFMGEGRLAIKMVEKPVRHSGPLVFGWPRWVLRQYVESTLIKYCLWPFHSRRWVRAYIMSARMSGLLREAWLTDRPKKSPA